MASLSSSILSPPAIIVPAPYALRDLEFYMKSLAARKCVSEADSLDVNLILTDKNNGPAPEPLYIRRIIKARAQRKESNDDGDRVK